MKLKVWFVFAVMVLCATSVMAQGRGRRGSKGGASAEKKTDQVIQITEITGVSGDSDYLAEVPQEVEKWKLKINHKDTFKKNGVKGWHYFEVAYQVANAGTDSAGKKKPILALPEVEVTYAVLYDMMKSKHAQSVYKNAQKAGGAIGWDDPKTKYVMLTDTVTYLDITPGREHYAAVCVPPSFVAMAGEPILFSVQIKVDGVQQGEIKTELQGGAKIDGKEIAGLAKAEGDAAVWWERIQNLTDAVQKRDGILRDRSQTPFVMAGDNYYDQVKAK